MRRRIGLGLAMTLLSLGAHSQQNAATIQDPKWDSVVGAVGEVGAPSPHWFAIRGQNIGYLVDGDAGEVQGSMTLSMFSPALRPDIAKGRIYTYGSFYTRTYYGDRTDVVLTFDARTMQPIGEVEIPPKSAGIGHSGMIGLVGGRFIAVWNITPAMSVSVVDTAQNEFVGEISTPGCAAIYPVGMGFLMPCGDGALQYVALNDDGTEASRTRSRSFYSVSDDPVYDYAVPTESGWLFLSFDGQVFEATWNDGEITVSEPWSIISENAEEDEEEKGWRIGGNQPFAYNPETGLLVTLMHQGGGQETFESAGTQAWGFDLAQQRRGYRLALEAPAVGLQLTQDARPLLIVSPEEDGTLRIHDGLSGRKLRDVTEIGGGLIQNLSAAGP